jgi:hypothetical protein
MSKFTKQKSVRLLNQTSINIINIKHNASVVGLNKIYSQQERPFLRRQTSINNNISIQVNPELLDDPMGHEENLDLTGLMRDVLLENIYPDTELILTPGFNRNPTIETNKINFGASSSLDYLYKKQLYKSKK